MEEIQDVGLDLCLVMVNTVFRLFERDIHELALEALILDDIHTLEVLLKTAGHGAGLGSQLGIQEIEAAQLPRLLPDVDIAVVNGNYALDFGLKTDEAIYKDSVLDVEEYWNLIAARTADVEDPDTAAIYEKVVEAFQSSATEDVFNNTFGGYFIAVGWDQDLINQ